MSDNVDFIMNSIDTHSLLNKIHVLKKVLEDKTSFTDCLQNDDQVIDLMDKL